jgi:hypothetical protein
MSLLTLWAPLHPFHIEDGFAMGMANNLQRGIYLEGLSWLTKERHAGSSIQKHRWITCLQGQTTQIKQVLLLSSG